MDDLQQLLLAQIAGDAGAPALSLPELVEQSMADDPIAAPLAAALRRRQAAEAAETDPTPAPPADPAVADVLERLYAELEELRLRTRTLADALGACARCWGEDPDCPVCRGRGHPGGRAPDPELFDYWVAPVARRRRQHEPEPAGAGAPPPLGGPHA